MNPHLFCYYCLIHRIDCHFVIKLPDDSVNRLEPERGAGKNIVDVADDLSATPVSTVAQVMERLAHVQLIHQIVPSEGAK